MDIYLDANATTEVIAQARRAVLEAMGRNFGNPSSIHSAGLRARDLVDAARAQARRVLGAGAGRLLFVSGATEAIQTAVLSALAALRTPHRRGAELLLYGATEHKAVPEALRHWNALLGLGMQVLAIPVDGDGRHDLDWLRRHVPRAGLVCTMAANNETGVVSDLAGIERSLEGSAALWLVDCVQALGKMDLALDRHRIDYASYSGHKLYAPKGIGMLYVREGAPFTPLLAGGGQENALRSGTENMVGIAGLGVVLQGLADRSMFRPPATLSAYRARLADALRDAFPGLVFNVPAEISLPTTLNFSVPGVPSRLLLDLFDAAGVRISGGSACSASGAQPSYVLEAMGLPAWRTASAVRLSFGPAADDAFIAEACARIRACGASLRGSGHSAAGPGLPDAPEGLVRLEADGACCYLLSDDAARTCVVLDPAPALAGRIAEWIASRGHRLAAVLGTGAPDRIGDDVRRILPAAGPVDPQGWPMGADRLAIGGGALVRLPCRGGTAYALEEAGRARLAFIGEMDPLGLGPGIDAGTVLLPGRDPSGRYATTVEIERSGDPGAAVPEPIEVGGPALRDLVARCPDLLLVDVREPWEQRVGVRPALGEHVRHQAVGLSGLPGSLPGWLRSSGSTPIVFFCRTGNRSARAARALRRLGHPQSWSLAGGVARWPAP